VYTTRRENFKNLSLLQGVKIALVCEVTGSMTNGKYLLLHVYILVYNRSIIVRIFPFAEGFLPPKIVGTFYMQGYKVKEKTAIVPPVSKLSGHPDLLQCSS
jgi:hypothetical protein